MNKNFVIVLATLAIVIAFAMLLMFSGAMNIFQTKTPVCVVGGCSGELCVDSTDNYSSSRMSICIWSDKFECYKTATCEIQSTGKCGWTATSQLSACLSNATGL